MSLVPASARVLQSPLEAHIARIQKQLKEETKNIPEKATLADIGRFELCNGEIRSENLFAPCNYSLRVEHLGALDGSDEDPIPIDFAIGLIASQQQAQFKHETMIFNVPGFERNDDVPVDVLFERLLRNGLTDVYQKKVLVFPVFSDADTYLTVLANPIYALVPRGLAVNAGPRRRAAHLPEKVMEFMRLAANHFHPEMELGNTDHPSTYSNQSWLTQLDVLGYFEMFTLHYSPGLAFPRIEGTLEQHIGRFVRKLAAEIKKTVDENSTPRSRMLLFEREKILFRMKREAAGPMQN